MRNTTILPEIPEIQKLLLEVETEVETLCACEWSSFIDLCFTGPPVRRVGRKLRREFIIISDFVQFGPPRREKITLEFDR